MSYIPNREDNNNTNYMYGTADNKIEAERLAGLNPLHNPHTLKYLTPFIINCEKILELGCGSGQLGHEVMKLAAPVCQYIGADRDPAQIELSKKELAEYGERVRLMQLDVVKEFDTLKDLGPFDLIYCRWLLVHLPKNELILVLKKIMTLLSDNGCFFCDECDNRSVTFKPLKEEENTLTISAKATQGWKDISQALMRTLGNDLELTAEKISNLLIQASDGKGSVHILGQYQVTLKESNEKLLIKNGYQSSASILLKACNKKPEELNEMLAPFAECAKDKNIEVPFLTENVVAFKR